MTSIHSIDDRTRQLVFERDMLMEQVLKCMVEIDSLGHKISLMSKQDNTICTMCPKCSNKRPFRLSSLRQNSLRRKKKRNLVSLTNEGDGNASEKDASENLVQTWDSIRSVYSCPEDSLEYFESDDEDERNDSGKDCDSLVGIEGLAGQTFRGKDHQNENFSLKSYSDAIVDKKLIDRFGVNVFKNNQSLVGSEVLNVKPLVRIQEVQTATEDGLHQSLGGINQNEVLVSKTGAKSAIDDDIDEVAPGELFETWGSIKSNHAENTIDTESINHDEKKDDDKYSSECSKKNLGGEDAETNFFLSFLKRPQQLKNTELKHLNQAISQNEGVSSANCAAEVLKEVHVGQKRGRLDRRWTWNAYDFNKKENFHLFASIRSSIAAS